GLKEICHEIDVRFSAETSGAVLGHRFADEVEQILERTLAPLAHEVVAVERRDVPARIAVELGTMTGRAGILVRIPSALGLRAGVHAVPDRAPFAWTLRGDADTDCRHCHGEERREARPHARAGLHSSGIANRIRTRTVR